MDGTVVGSYRIGEKIAVGGMGEVYAANHQVLNRQAVIKILLPEMCDKELIVKRFFQEAQATAKIRHPGIVEVLDYGTTDDGRAYIVMERLDGETLHARLQRCSTLPLDRAVALMCQLARAVGAAHQHKIVHRDLKPGNLFIVPDPEVPGGERIKVLDFGLAKLKQANMEDAPMTVIGTVFGTPAYMAPEQCSDAASVDHRADLYSIGCIFYRCLAGKAPFGSGGGVEMLMAQLRHTPTPVGQLVAGIPPRIDAVVMRLLEKPPERRPQSCDELIRALDNPPSHGYPSNRSSGQAAYSQRAAGAPQDAIWPGPGSAPSAPALPGMPPPRAPLGTGTNAGFGTSAGPAFARPSTSLSVSAGEIEMLDRSRDGGSPPRRRWSRLARIAAVAGTLVLVGTGALVLAQLGQESGEPAGPPVVVVQSADAGIPADDPQMVTVWQRRMTRASQQLEGLEWGAALATLRQCSKLEIRQPERLREMDQLRHKAETELQNQLRFEKFRLAVKGEDMRHIADSYSLLPETSVYRDKATPAFRKLVDQWLESKDRRARRLYRSGRCKDLDALMAEITAIIELVAPADYRDRDGAAKPCQERQGKPSSRRGILQPGDLE